MKWVAFKGLSDKKERLFGGTVRILGIDFSVVMVGWINEWKLIDLKIPANYGVYLQVLFLSVSIGHLPNDYFHKD